MTWRKSTYSHPAKACVEWTKSSYSYANSDCPEVCRLARGAVALRDSKLREPTLLGRNVSPVLSFSRAGWEAFTAGVKAGDLDRLAGGPA